MLILRLIAVFMTHVSRKKLTNESKKKLITQFVSLFAAADKKKTGFIFDSLFTESEQIMFIKRVAIILMLDRGYSRYRIAKTLIVSESTVKQFFMRYKAGDFSAFVDLSKSKNFDATAFWSTVEVILRGGLPPRTKDKWKYVPGMGR